MSSTVSDGGDSQRLDKWLWCARFFKTRGLANRILGGGKLRLSGKVVAKAHQKVRVGDVLTFPQGPHVRVVKVLSLAARRGPAPEAQTLYEDLAPPEARRPEPSDPAQFDVGDFDAVAPARPRGAGRPTKRDRRALDKLASEDP